MTIDLRVRTNSRPKSTATIRIYPKEREMWNQYCKAMGDSSPKLFSKILSSKEINLNQRIMTELDRKKEIYGRKIKFE